MLIFLLLSSIIFFIFPIVGAVFGLLAFIYMLMGERSLAFHRLYCIFFILWWIPSLLLLSQGSYDGSSMGGVETIDHYRWRVKIIYSVGLMAVFYSTLILIFFKKKLKDERRAWIYHAVLIAFFLVTGLLGLKYFLYPHKFGN